MRRARCPCGVQYERLCDARVKGRYCDTPLCDICAVSIAPGVDSCKEHATATSPLQPVRGGKKKD